MGIYFNFTQLFETSDANPAKSRLQRFRLAKKILKLNLPATGA